VEAGSMDHALLKPTVVVEEHTDSSVRN